LIWEILLGLSYSSTVSMLELNCTNVDRFLAMLELDCTNAVAKNDGFSPIEKILGVEVSVSIQLS
jgi:hypothetical protein